MIREKLTRGGGIICHRLARFIAVGLFYLLQQPICITAVQMRIVDASSNRVPDVVGVGAVCATFTDEFREGYTVVIRDRFQSGSSAQSIGTRHGGSIWDTSNGGTRSATIGR